MNWTGGGVYRYSQRSDSLVKRQKAHFAKVRAARSSASTRRYTDHKRKSSATRLDSAGPTDAIDALAQPADRFLQSTERHNDGLDPAVEERDVAALKARLLQESDWLGLDDRHGSRRHIDAAVKSSTSRKRRRWEGKASIPLATLPRQAEQGENRIHIASTLHTDDISIRIGTTADYVDNNDYLPDQGNHIEAAKLRRDSFPTGVQDDDYDQWQQPYVNRPATAHESLPTAPGYDQRDNVNEGDEVEDLLAPSQVPSRCEMSMNMSLQARVPDPAQTPPSSNDPGFVSSMINISPIVHDSSSSPIKRPIRIAPMHGVILANDLEHPPIRDDLSTVSWPDTVTHADPVKSELQADSESAEEQDEADLTPSTQEAPALPTEPPSSGHTSTPPGIPRPFPVPPGPAIEASETAISAQWESFFNSTDPSGFSPPNPHRAGRQPGTVQGGRDTTPPGCEGGTSPSVSMSEGASLAHLHSPHTSPLETRASVLGTQAPSLSLGSPLSFATSHGSNTGAG